VTFFIGTMILQRPVRLSKPGNIRSACALLKRADAYLLVAAEGSAFVLGIVIETLATLFTAEMRDARALGLGRGERTNAPERRETNATSASTPQCVSSSFIYANSAALLRLLTDVSARVASRR
jgi:hypothetical protein